MVGVSRLSRMRGGEAASRWWPGWCCKTELLMYISAGSVVVRCRGGLRLRVAVRIAADASWQSAAITCCSPALLLLSVWLATGVIAGAPIGRCRLMPAARPLNCWMGMATAGMPDLARGGCMGRQWLRSVDVITCTGVRVCMLLRTCRGCVSQDITVCRHHYRMRFADNHSGNFIVGCNAWVLLHVLLLVP